MMELTRKWRKCRYREGSLDGEGEDGCSLPTRDDFRPLDTREQLELVSSFERQHAWQSRIWRGVFTGFLLFYAGFLVHSIFQQVWHPSELYQAYFMDDVDSWMVISAGPRISEGQWRGCGLRVFGRLRGLKGSFYNLLKVLI